MQLSSISSASVQTPKTRTGRFGATQTATGTDFFCKVWRNELPDCKIVAQNKTGFAVLDGYPVNQGHTLIVPKRHVASFFEATEQEKHDILKLLSVCKAMLETAFQKKGLPQPAGWNIGVNVGKTAGQTVDHLHVHLIPRFPGDMADPKGGVRGVIPDKQKYSGPPDPTVGDFLS